MVHKPFETLLKLTDTPNILVDLIYHGLECSAVDLYLSQTGAFWKPVLNPFQHKSSTFMGSYLSPPGFNLFLFSLSLSVVVPRDMSSSAPQLYSFCMAWRSSNSLPNIIQFRME